jgi:hypothetical protein
MRMNTNLSLILGKEKKKSRGDEILVEHWVHDYLSRGQLEFALGISADSVNYWQNRLESRKLLKVWKRPTMRDQLETSLTYSGESYLEHAGYENRGYAKCLAQSDKPQRMHRLQVTSSSLGFLRAGEVEGRQVDVLPPLGLWVRGEEIWMDKIWTLDGEPLIVEIERSKKTGKELDKRFQQYADCVTDRVFEMYGLTGRIRVLCITPTPGKLKALQEAAMNAHMNALFFFTHEGIFRSDCTWMLSEPIWQLCTG